MRPTTPYSLGMAIMAQAVFVTASSTVRRNARVTSGRQGTVTACSIIDAEAKAVAPKLR